MIYRIQTQQLISNPVDLAQRKLQSHKENGIQSKLSIFEVAQLMDQVHFERPQSKSSGESYFDICFN